MKAVILLFFLLFALIVLALVIVSIAGKWKMFEKAGRPGWAAIIPYYNTYVEFDIAWNNELLPVK